MEGSVFVSGRRRRRRRAWFVVCGWVAAAIRRAASVLCEHVVEHLGNGEKRVLFCDVCLEERYRHGNDGYDVVRTGKGRLRG